MAPLRVGYPAVEIERCRIRLATGCTNGGKPIFHVDKLSFKGANAPSGHAFELADGIVPAAVLNYGSIGVTHEPSPRRSKVHSGQKRSAVRNT
jgi:hypothetical protein